MKEYLNRFIGKKVCLSLLGGMKESVIEGAIKEIVGDVVVIDAGEDGEIALPINKITMISQPEKDRPGKSMGFR